MRYDVVGCRDYEAFVTTKRQKLARNTAPKEAVSPPIMAESNLIDTDQDESLTTEFPNFREFFEESEFTKLFSSPPKSRSPSVSSIETVVHAPLPIESPTPPPRRNRARSNSISGVNPLRVRFTGAEAQLETIIANIDTQGQFEERGTIYVRDFAVNPAHRQEQPDRTLEQSERIRRKADLTTSGGYRGTELTRLTTGDFTRRASLRTSASTTPPSRPLPIPPQRRRARSPPPLRPDTYQPPSSPPLLRPDTYQPPSSPPLLHPDTYQSVSPPSPSVSSFPATVTMNNNFQYIDPPQGAPGSNPRQAPPSPSQSLTHSNGTNGAAGFGGNMVGFPTPAGHQSDLNFVMSKIEELSRTLEHNRRLTDDIVTKVGLVRERAKDKNLTNDELVALVTSEMGGMTCFQYSQAITNIDIDTGSNMEKELSELRKALEHANYEKDENFKLCQHACHILSDVLDKMHDFKAKNESDYLAWHKSYRNQLAAEREENLELRCRIADMQAHAANASAWIRKAQRWHDDHDEFHELKVLNQFHRLRGRFFRRLALPHIPDDDPDEWSDDDDLIDPEEKKRLEKMKNDRSERSERDSSGPSGTSASSGSS
ncbi:hypothetical protein B7494_g5675 [Chlorociboria aeruginascens]|nr:hypothetical protein B7494_g5675 [Chlorociboria aeruginascens]